MKRIYISLAFFILSIATGIFEMFYVTNRIDELNEEIVSADNLVKSENYDGAKDVLAAAESKWQKNLSIFDILLIHDYVDEINAVICRYTEQRQLPCRKCGHKKTAHLRKGQ